MKPVSIKSSIAHLQNLTLAHFSVASISQIRQIPLLQLQGISTQCDKKCGSAGEAFITTGLRELLQCYFQELVIRGESLSVVHPCPSVSQSVSQSVTLSWLSHRGAFACFIAFYNLLQIMHFCKCFRGKQGNQKQQLRLYGGSTGQKRNTQTTLILRCSKSWLTDFENVQCTRLILRLRFRIK